MTAHGTAKRLAARYGYEDGHDLAIAQAKGMELALVLFPAMRPERVETYRTRIGFWRTVARYVWSAKVTNDIRGMLP